MQDVRTNSIFAELVNSITTGLPLQDSHRKWGGGVLDIVKSPGDYVLGVVYEIPKDAVISIDLREGAPLCYRRIENIKVVLGFEQVEVFTYEIVDKEIDENKPAEKYFEIVYKGMKNHFPSEYINKYLIDHCQNFFGMKIK